MTVTWRLLKTVMLIIFHQSTQTWKILAPIYAVIEKECAMLYGYISQRTVHNKGQIQFKAITVYVADWGPNFGVPWRGCVFYIMSATSCVCKFVHCCTCTASSGLCIGVTWLITLGVLNWPWALGTLIYEAANLERRERLAWASL
jgi:hypothetical protein